MALPSGYKPVEYITCAGKQWFDTGIAPSANLAVEICVKPASAGLKENAIFGAFWNVDGFFLMFYNNQVKFHSKGTDATTSGFDATVKSVIRCTQTSLVVNGTSYSLNGSGSDVTYNISMFTVTNSGVGSNNAAMYGDCYYCKMWQGTTLVRDYQPCLNSSGVPGMYDLVNGVFYSSTSGTAFASGPITSVGRLEYIESNGTQYIDTGFKPNQDTRVVCTFQLASYSAASGIFGQRKGAAEETYLFLYNPGQTAFRSDYNTGNGQTFSVGNVLARYKVDKDQNSTTFNGVTETYPAGDFQATYSMYLFCSNNAGVASWMSSMRLYSCQIYDDGILVRDYIPYRYNGEVGLYDQLNEIFYENAGTGDFVAGPIAKYARVEYLESTGTQYIDTELPIGPQNAAGIKSVVDKQILSAAQYSLDGTGYGATPYFNSFYVGVGSNMIAYGNGRTDEFTTIAYDGGRKTFSYSGTGEIEITGLQKIAFTFQAPDTALNFLLFAYNQGANGIRCYSGKIFSAKLYQNGTLVRDLVPAVRADGTPGLLDQANNAFYTNSGTGTFVVGPDLDYTKLEYIESTGTQYVDTGFIPNQDTRVVMDCQAYSVYNGDSFPFGVRASTSSKAFAVALVESQVFYNYASNYQFADYPTTLERMMIDANKNVATFAGSTTATISLASGTFACDSTLLLATFNNAGTPDVGDPAWVGAIWSCQIYDNGVLIRDYVPALRENGQIGLIDLVSGLFYANAGSGVFIAGPEIVDPDPPEPPGPYEPPSFTEQTLAYLAALRYPFYKLCRLRFLQPDGSTAFSLDNNPKNRRSGAFIADGSISANLQNGKRRNATVTLSNLDSSFDYNVNTVWFGTEIAVDEGLVLPDGSEYYIQQGVFAIENPTEAVEPANRTATYNLVDKWSYLDGTLFGNLESTYEVPVGTNIFQPIQAILALDRGNGQPVDGVTPIFTEYYNSKTQALPDGSTASLIDSPYTLRIDSDNGTYADVLLGLAAMVNAWIGYDQTGALRIDPSQDDILDTNKPILWQFSMDEATFLGANYTVRNVDVYNDYIVLGELLDDNSQPAGRATNLDPRSDTNVQTIGRKTFRMSAPGFATDQQCQDLAVWKLKRSTSLQKAITISCSQLFHIEENGLVTIVRTDKPGSPVERHLVMGFTRPLTSNGEMQINAVSVQDFVTATVTSWPE